MTRPPSAEGRILRWPGCRNVRDLGGLPTSWGGRVRRGALVRSARPAAATLPALTGYGIRLVADLRLAAECAADPSPLAGAEGGGHGPVPDGGQRSVPGGGEGLVPGGEGWPVWRRLPVLRDEDAVLEEMGDTLPEIYRRILDEGAPLFAAALAALAQAPPGGVLVHCHSGKDRTGLVVALALSVAGVPEDEIAADYALTAACLSLDGHLAALQGEAARARSRRLFAEVTAATMAATLEHLRGRHGGAEAYLRDAGLSPEDARLLRARLTGQGQTSTGPPLRQ
ncbi:tyrosine-protein phosphatase [Nonomuraea pusilla]|uniref:tyrosine-protein phosphatase n=1 Tax=Nonomuraea pusilla TaxID=46177 RepID=UPI00332F58F1